MSTALPPQNVVDTVKVTAKLLRGGWHPIQLQSLTILVEREASPKEIAVELGLTKSKAGYVSHHCKELVAKGLVELTKTVPRRGANEHFYRAILPLIVMDNDAERMSFEERILLSCWIVKLMSHDLVQAIESGTIDERPDRHLTRHPLRVDEQGYEELIHEFACMFQRVEEISTASTERLDETGEVGRRVSAILGCFPMPNGLGSLYQ